MKSTVSLLISALCLATATQAGAANEYSTLLKARKLADVEKLAAVKLAQEPGNADALIATSEALLASGPSKFERAITVGEQCIAANPRHSGCQLAYGRALGAKALNVGIMSAMGYAGKIRDAFVTALELDPNNLEARFSLLQYYMQAPMIVGGGSGKARTLIGQTAPINRDAAVLMTGSMDLADDQAGKAETAAISVRPGANEALADAQRDLLMALAGHYLGEKKLDNSERLYREVKTRFPDSPWADFGIARVRQEQGRGPEALAGFEKVLLAYPRPNVHVRMAQTLQAMGEHARARAEYETVLAAKEGLSADMRKDAEAQLKTLKK